MSSAKDDAEGANPVQMAAPKPTVRVLKRPAGGTGPHVKPIQASVPQPEVPDPWDVHLERARALSIELSAATDALNASLRKAEQALAELNLGVTAAVSLYPMTPQEAARTDWHQALRFGKDATGWRLILESYPDDGAPEDTIESPLLNASKEVRLQAAARLPALLERLVKTAEEQLAFVKIRAAEAELFASTVTRRKR